MATTMRIVLGLLTLVTCGMLLGALIQLAFIRRMEDSLDRELSFGGKHASLTGTNFPLARGLCCSVNVFKACMCSMLLKARLRCTQALKPGAA